MQEKITFSQLCTLVSSRASVPRKTTEEYLRAFFSMIADGLTENETVKIKGLGTFKTTGIAERRSVNVSTGQDIVIPAHYRISFIPAQAMAAAVNAPFAAFDSVELADDFTDEELAAIDNADQIKREAEPEEEVSTVAATEPAAGVDTSVPEIPPEQQEEELPFEIIVPVQQPESEPPAKAECPEEAENAPAESVPSESVPSESVPSESVTPPSSLSAGPEEEPPIADNLSPEMVSVANQRRKLRFTFWGGFCAALALVAIIGGNIILFWPQLLRINPWPSEQEQRMEATVTGRGVQQNRSTAVSFDDQAEKHVLMPVTEPGNEAKAAPDDEEANKAAAIPVYDTISKTRYLTTMAKEHYGNYHLWPYIYEENKSFLGHPDRIKPGTRVVVPPLSKYGVDPNNPDDIREAKRKGTEIYARYQ